MKSTRFPRLSTFPDRIGLTLMILVISSDPILSMDIRQAIETVDRTPVFVQRTEHFDIGKLGSNGIRAAVIDLPYDHAEVARELDWVEKNRIPTIVLSTQDVSGFDMTRFPTVTEHFEKPVIVEDILPAMRRALNWNGELASANSVAVPTKLRSSNFYR